MSDNFDSYDANIIVQNTKRKRDEIDTSLDIDDEDQDTFLDDYEDDEEDTEMISGDINDEDDMIGIDCDSDGEGKKKKKKKTVKRKKKYNIVVREAEGFLFGSGQNNNIKSMNFYILKKIRCPKNTPRIIPVNYYGAFPTYCPWILYKIKFTAPSPTEPGLFKIIEIVECLFSVIKKEKVKQYMVMLKKDPDLEYKKLITKRFRNVPAIITTKSDLNKLDDPVIQSQVLKILAPRFSNNAITQLLPYFSYTFLSRFTEEQLLIFIYIMIEMPYLYMFWDRFVSIVLTIKSGSRFIFQNKRDDLYQKPEYIYRMLQFYKDVFQKRKELKRKENEDDIDEDEIDLDIDEKEMIARLEDERETKNPCVPTFYDHNNLPWNINLLKKSIRSFKRWNPDNYDFETIEMAQYLYLCFQEEKLSFKNSIFQVNSKRIGFEKDDVLVQKAISFLRNYKILISQFDSTYAIEKHFQCDKSFIKEQEYVDTNLLMEITTSMMEIEFASMLYQRKDYIRLYECDDYGHEYISDFTDLIDEVILPEAVRDRQDILWLSANEKTAYYMKRLSGNEFKSVSEYINWVNNDPKNPARTITKLSSGFSLNNVPNSPDIRSSQRSQKKYVVIDHIHKTKISEILELFKILPVNANIYIFGDNTEYGPDSKRNIHHLFYELTKIFPSTKIYQESKSAAYQLRQDIKQKKLKDLDIEILNNRRNLDAYLNDITKSKENGEPSNKKRKHFVPSKQAEQEKNSDGYVIFCSNEEDRKMVSKFMNKETFVENSYQLWDKVRIVENDIIGRISQVYRIDDLGNRLSQIEEKKPFFINSGLYEIHIYKIDKVFISSKITIQHAAVSVISKYGDIPSDWIIFMVTKNTFYNDIVVASKYALRRMKIFLIDTVMDQVLHKEKNIFRQHNTDLFTKYKQIKTSSLLHS